MNILRKTFLSCGILSSLLYVAMNIFVAAQDPAYSSLASTVSELSAIGAPTRALWVSWGFVYTVLVIAFGYGIWISAAENHLLRIVGALVTFYGALGLGWPFAPMHTRDVLAAGGGTLSDTMHIVFSVVTVLLMLFAMGFGAKAFKGRFQIYTILTMVILSFFGALTGFDAPNLEANLPTPWIGLWERINIGLFLLWIVVLAIVLLKKQNDPNLTSALAQPQH